MPGVPDDLAMFAEAILTVDIPGGRRVIKPLPAGSIDGAFPFAQPVYVVTAFNPRGEIDADHINEQRHRDLLSAVHALGVESFPTVGSAPDGSLAEPGVMVVGIGRDAALGLGRRFAQTAVYEWRRDGLEILGALAPGSLLLGWAVEGVAGRDLLQEEPASDLRTET